MLCFDPYMFFRPNDIPRVVRSVSFIYELGKYYVSNGAFGTIMQCSRRPCWWLALWSVASMAIWAHEIPIPEADNLWISWDPTSFLHYWSFSYLEQSLNMNSISITTRRPPSLPGSRVTSSQLTMKSGILVHWTHPKIPETCTPGFKCASFMIYTRVHCSILDSSQSSTTHLPISAFAIWPFVRTCLAISKYFDKLYRHLFSQFVLVNVCRRCSIKAS